MQDFEQFIFDWWKENKRDLPWRRTHDPYKILVSEVMLQQTQVARVLPKYIEFTNKFPSVQALANAAPASVLRLWKGMGYNRRALYLHKTAKIIVKNFGGIFPQDENILLTLPGLGKYTVRALLVFAFKKDAAMVDTNIRQIITHFFFNDVPQKEAVIQETADRLLPVGRAWEWHQALMDFGALEIKNLKPKITLPAKVHGESKKSPFHQTNRFFRGKMVDALREGTIEEMALLKEFSETYKKPEEFLLTILHSLEKDGLVSRSEKGIVSLPR